MRKIVSLLCMCLSILITSCGSDDDATPNLPPMEVANIEAEVIEGTLVNISWTEAEDVNNDELSYDVIVNGRVVATKTSELSIQYDVTSLLNIRSREAQKGLNIELIIAVKAYDGNGGVSEESTVKRYVFVNRDPDAFDFANINFDFSYYNWLEISWYPALDEDGDIISYDVYFNDILLREDYIIGSDDYDGLGSVSYNNSYAEYVNDEIIIKVVAKDRDGGITEISKSFDFKATDVDLSTLTLPYENTFDYTITEDEADRRIGYTFTIDQETGYAISSVSSNQDIVLRDENGNFINSGGTKVSGAALSPGNYYVEVSSYYGDIDVSGTLLFTFRDAKETDVDLGLFTTPYSGNQELLIEFNEPDNSVGFAFEVDSSTGFSVSTVSNVYFNLYNETGSFIASGYNNITATSLPLGFYYLEVSNSNYNSGIEGTMAITFQDYNTSDVDLETLTTPYSQTFNYDTTNEVDRVIRYNFTVNSTVNYDFEIISANHDTYLYIYDASGNVISADDDGGVGTLSKLTGSLAAGAYAIEVAGFGSSVGSGTLSVNLQ